MLKTSACVFGLGLALLAITERASAADEGAAASSSTDGAEGAAAAIDVAPAEPSDWDVNVSLLEEYRLRIASHLLPSTGVLGDAAVGNQETDQHLRLLGDLDVTGAGEHFRAVASGALYWDIDGPSPSEAGSQFATQYDNANPYVAAYALSAEWQRDGSLDHARIGRQSSEHGMPLTFDGASLGLRLFESRLLFFGFGGKTVHFFESKPGFFENWVGSTGAVYRPSVGTALELDTRATREQVLNEDRSARDSVTNLSYGLSAAWRNDLMYAKGYTRGVDHVVSHAGGAFQFQHSGLGLGVDARIHAQLVTLGEVVESENPFFSLLGPSLPFARFRFEAWKDVSIGEQSNLSLHLGWRQRQLIAQDEQPFNRNTGALYLHTRVDDFVERGLFVGATAEWNYVPSTLLDEWLLAYGGSAGYGNSTIKSELGTYFQQFKINYYRQAEELHDTRTVYGSIAYRIFDELELRGRYEIDVFDRYLQSFYLSARQDF